MGVACDGQNWRSNLGSSAIEPVFRITALSKSPGCSFFDPLSCFPEFLMSPPLPCAPLRALRIKHVLDRQGACLQGVVGLLEERVNRQIKK